MSPTLRKQLNTSRSTSSDEDAGSTDENILLKEMIELEDEFGAVFDK
jgi:hypothetical protein